MKRKGFTVVELLVVMVIIAMLAAMLLPALRKARAKSARDKAKNEMAAIASAMIMVKNDIGYYVRICDLSESETTNNNDGVTDPIYYFDDTGLLIQVTSGKSYPWDGPYQVFQENSVFSASRGRLPTIDGATGWILVAADLYGTPLDPWGHPYFVAYNSTDKVMIIYSAGPDGKIQTNAGSKQPPANSDDIVYVFR